ncbi:MAG: EscE/YscE/SsaE family type III secretion system needle protein co-chaperone [Janthinobacterium lividum]
MQFHRPATGGDTRPGGGNGMDLLSGIVTALEVRLAGDDGVHVGASLAGQFALAQARLEQHLRQGLPPERFATVRACAEALRAAREVLAAQSRECDECGDAASRARPHPLLSPIASSRN